MRKFKLLLALLLVLAITPIASGVLAPGARAETVIASGTVVNYFNSLVGNSWPSGKCLNFVRTCWQNLGAAYSSSCCAYNYGSSHIQSTDINSIPVGADVFFGNCGGGPCGSCGSSYYGHIGVYVGGGYFVHATGGSVQKTLVSDWSSKFRGWGYHGGVRIVQDNTELNDGPSGIDDGRVTEQYSNRIAFSLDNLETIGKTLHLYGWAYDKNNPSAQVTIHVYPGEGVQGYVTSSHRPDVNSAFGIDGLHGFDIYCETNLTTSVSISIDALYTDNTGAENIIKGTVTYHNEYKVTYNANGGSGAPSTQKKIDGTNLKLSTSVPSRTGYMFAGWATSKTGSVAYQPGNTYTNNAAVTLYAQWVANTFNVDYNANGGSGAPEYQTKTYGVDLTLSSTKPTRSGYTFLGWATASNASSAEYAAGATYSGNEDLQLYAVWARRNYVVTYDANGGSGAPSTQYKSPGERLQLSLTIPHRIGYTFSYWGDNPDPNSGVMGCYQPGQYYYEDKDLALFAHWKIDQYTISYDANGGSGAPDDQTKTYNVDLTLSTTAPTLEGYTFLGWAPEDSSTVVEYQPGDTYTDNQSVKFYAVWQPNDFNLTYHANGGTGAPAPQTIGYGILTSISATKPSREGYDFLGWASSATLDTAEYQPNSGAVFYADTDLYAVWRLRTYTVTFDANGGSDAPAAQIKQHGVDLTLSDTTPVREGFSFEGWSSNPTATLPSCQPGSIYITNEDLDLYAVWKPLTYTVVYDAKNGTNAPASQTKGYNEDLILSSETPVREHWIFMGWSKNKYPVDYDYQPGDIYSENADLTLYALWMKETYRITYDANGGSDAPASQVKYTNDIITLSTEVPTRSGYAFLGWATSRTATAAEYQPGDTYAADANLNLYAVWDRRYVDVASITLSQRSLDIKEREEVLLTATVLPADATDPSLTWSSSNSAVASVDGDGLVKGISAGSCAIIVKDASGSISAYCFVNVEENPLVTMRLPDALTEIGTEAFSGDESIGIVILGNKVVKISNGAFQNCVNMSEIWIPASVGTIGNNAFSGCSKLTIHCVADSIAWYYAMSHDIPCVTDYQ